MKKKEIYRHYGSNKFNKDEFINVFNTPYSNKPSGGLWSCPTIDVDISWNEWSKSNDFRLDKLEEYFDFTLSEDAKVLEIKDIKDLANLPTIRQDYCLGIYDVNIDFEAISKEYDAMMVWMYRSEDLDDSVRMFDGMYYKLYGWDVDTLLVFNPNVIKEI